MPPLPASIGRYQVVSRLGEGGMGTVYLAKDPELQRTVAIKILSAYIDQSAHGAELRERFAREARSVAGLKHNNIVTIFDIGEDGGRPYIAMEFLDGESMAELIRRRAPLPIDRKLGIILDLCAGLGYAHRNGIIHRDIKPANLMITSDGVLKILDFGLARLATEATNVGLTRKGAIMGTPQYMSPEQIQGGTVDHRTDIFSVGLVAYELLTYHRAYAGDPSQGFLHILHNILSGKPRSMRELVPTIDAELEQAVNKAIESSPAARYQTLVELSGDLTRIRRRIVESAEQQTIRVGHSPADRLGIAEKRAKQIEMHLQSAVSLASEGQYQEAIERAEQALLIDPQDQRILEFIDRTRQADDDRQVKQWLDQAQTVLERGEFTEAEALVEQTLKLRPGSTDAQRLRQDIREARRQHERLAEIGRVVRLATDRGRTSLNQGAFESAIRSADEALAYDPNHEEARALKRDAVAALDRQRREEQDQQAAEIVEAARRQSASGDLPGALAALRAFAPSHQKVTAALLDLEREFERQDAERRAAAHKATARTALQEGRFADALTALDQAATVVFGDADVTRLRNDVEAARAEADAAQRRAAEAERKLSEADASVRRDDLKGALKLVQAALALQPGHANAVQLEARVRELIDTRARQETEKRSADDAIARARRAFKKGDHDAALRLLEGFAPQALVTPVLEELRAKRQQIEDDRKRALAQPVAPTAAAEEPGIRAMEFRGRPLWLALGAVALLLVVVTTFYVVRKNRTSGEGSLAQAPAREQTQATTTMPTQTPAKAPQPSAQADVPPAVAAQVPVTVDLHPWARVTIASASGAKVGNAALVTPFTIKLDPGEYVLTGVNDRLSPPITDTFRITVVANQPQTISRPLRGFDPDRVLNSLLGPPK